MSVEVESLYKDSGQWAEGKTMEHASGIWGRVPMLKYLEKEILRPGQSVVDLGSGAGYPTFLMSQLVGLNGSVVGLESSSAMFDEALRSYAPIANLEFMRADITEPFPSSVTEINVVTSFMVCHNLFLPDLGKMFSHVENVLAEGGRVVFLTMHPEALESEPWDMDFMVYDEVGLRLYREFSNKEGVEVPGLVRNVGGGSKRVWMINHTRSNMLKVIEGAGLQLLEEQDLWIDEPTARTKFGDAAVRRVPTTPTFWMFTLKKRE